MYTTATSITAAFALSGNSLVTSFMVGMTLLAFLVTWAFNRISILRIRKRAGLSKELSDIMQRTLDISHDYVLRLNVPTHYATNLHGDFLPPEGMSYEECATMVHPDDRARFHQYMLQMMDNKEDTTECTFRWDRSGRAHQGDWRHMHSVGVMERKGQRQATTLFCTLTDQTEQILSEQEERDMTEKYRKIFEQSIVGLAFYDKDGHLLTTNSKMREILKFQSDDDPYYYQQTLFDMPAFNDIMSNRRAEELYFCTKSVITDRGVYCYTELRVHPIYDESGELVYITLSIRDVTQERELYLQNKRNDQEIRRANEEIHQYETELQYLMENCDMRFWRTDFKERTITFYKELSKPEKTLTFDEFQTYFVDDEGTIARNFEHPEEHFREPVAYLCHMRPIYHESDRLLWNMIDNVPNFDADGHLIGCYGVIRNLTELIEKQEKLKEETERANDSGRLKSVFMANMTHEIRTPLNSIVGFSDILPMLSTQEEKQEIVRVIMNNCDMLLRLINDILAISSLDTGGIHIEPREVDFAHSFDDICESLRQRVTEPGVTFIEENPYKLFTTVIDNGRIQQVITNFVTNAVKYTHQGHIKVGYRYQEQGLYVYCEDTGDGIPKEAQEKIFDRFVKLNDFIQGTGLGLSICKAIADGCKGRIGVVSEGKDKGSTFWLWVPCEPIDAEEKGERKEEGEQT